MVESSLGSDLPCKCFPSGAYTVRSALLHRTGVLGMWSPVGGAEGRKIVS